MECYNNKHLLKKEETSQTKKLTLYHEELEKEQSPNLPEGRS